MDDDQRHARIFGVLFIITFITSIGALSLFQPVLDVIPEFIWEAFLGIYCAIWGFRRDSPILSPGRRFDPRASAPAPAG
jgi:hypothetical protein